MADGIIPSGDELDEGLCNGICSALRASDEQVKQEWKEFGFEGQPPQHACLRPPDP
ncbi:MAG TPA: hypothetical protein VJ020_12025 [Anaerolineales bacterium]|nr:hypothetical protein [Anaerolineales bacterium]